jgi:hypothetical protein
MLDAWMPGFAGCWSAASVSSVLSAAPSGDPAHETDRKILKSAQQVFKMVFILDTHKTKLSITTGVSKSPTSLKSNQQQQKSSASCGGW